MTRARWVAAIAEMVFGVIGYALLWHAAGFEVSTAILFLMWSVNCRRRYEWLVQEDAERERAAFPLYRYSRGRVSG